MTRDDFERIKALSKIDSCLDLITVQEFRDIIEETESAHKLVADVMQAAMNFGLELERLAK